MKKSQITFVVFITVILSSCLNNSKDSYTFSSEEKATINQVSDFIKNNWQNTIRFHPKDSTTIFGLPKPYNVPCIDGAFQEMYYWDTYFTNLGLIRNGLVEQAKYNCDNILFMVDRFGYMLNGNRTWFLNRSQPPYLSMMVRDVYEVTKDTAWLATCMPGLEKEYDFWTLKRNTPVGLSHYSSSGTNADKMDAFFGAATRLGKNFDTSAIQSVSERLTIGAHLLAECESGWDYNPRFHDRCEDFCPLDLNCNLYMYEMNFSYFGSQLKHNDTLKWINLANNRKALINKYLYNPSDGLFYDYDYVNNKHSVIYSAAIFNTMWAKIASEKQAESIISNLSKLEYKFGIATCEPGTRKYNYQWDYPNGWACLQYIAVKGLANYNYTDDAKRIAYKYLLTVSLNFNKTQNLWEKYNITDGSINVSNEYEMPTMMSWTAGTFVYLSDYMLNE
jgi:alpha,alpha-trehalase